MYAIGIMSGTSLDGVDVAICKIDGHYLNTKIELIAFNTYSIPTDIRNKIKEACDLEKSNSALICSLNFELGYLFSDCVIKACKENNFDINKIDFIASHGQTIYHIPFSSEQYYASTMQIGEASIIAYQTNCCVISDFRVMDMAAFGQGAPLVPFSDFVLYSQKNKNIALENIGGIGNVTFLSETNNIDDILAFDTGPGNMMINEASLRFYNKEYDKDGIIASKGKVNEALLDYLMQHPYFKLDPPKSTGRELFGANYVNEVIDKYHYLNNEDIIATFTMFTSKSIAYHYHKYCKNLDEIIITGGGALNPTLVRFLKEEFIETKMNTLEELNGNSEAKEAIAFVVLGNETMHNSFSNVRSATGAKESVVLGKMIHKPRMSVNKNE